ncbi:MAG TPA: hypothetical protein VGA31_05700 [Thermoanaerobaculia bacterium]
METSGPSTPEDLVILLRSGRAPREIRLFAARRRLPLDPHDSLRALLAVLRDTDSETASAARENLRATPPDLLADFVTSGSPRGDELDLLAHESDDPFVLEEVVRCRAVDDGTLLFLAQTAAGRPQEAMIANQARLLGRPALIEALLENPALTGEGRRLLSELKEEFFEKETRRRVAEARRAEEEEAADAAASTLADEEDLGLDEEEGEGFETEDAPRDEEAESLFIGAIYRRVGLMTVGEKINLAYVGSKEERRVLVGDTNKLIGIAVLKSRAISINEIESFAAMRNLDEELYRRIAHSREWMRKPAVVLTLVRNPRVPLDISLPLLKRLATRELRGVVRDRNLAPVLRASAKKLLVQRRR